MAFQQKSRTISCIVIGDTCIETGSLSKQYLEEITAGDHGIGKGSYYESHVEVQGEKLQVILRDFVI